MTLSTSAGGQNIDVPVTVRHRGRLKEAPQLSLLEMVERFDGKALGLVIGSIAQQMAPDVDEIADASAGMFLKRVNIVALDVAHDRPHHTRYERSIFSAGGAILQTEIRETEFDWMHAVGCQRH